MKKQKAMNEKESQVQFDQICSELTQLHARKNHDYGNAFGNVYQEFAAQNLVMADGYAVGTLLVKVERAKTLVSNEAYVKEESIEDSLQDLACYAIMTLMERRIAKKQFPNENKQG